MVEIERENGSYNIPDYPVGTKFLIKYFGMSESSLEVKSVEVPFEFENKCESCIFNSICENGDLRAKCCDWEREDERDVIFKDVKDVERFKKELQESIAKDSESTILQLPNPKEQEFYMNCAIAAMQGIQESGSKVISELSEVFIKETAKKAFDLADAMMEEYHKRVK